MELPKDHSPASALVIEERLRSIENEVERLLRQRTEDQIERQQRLRGMLMGAALVIWILVILRSLRSEA